MGKNSRMSSVLTPNAGTGDTEVCFVVVHQTKGQEPRESIFVAISGRVFHSGTAGSVTPFTIHRDCWDLAVAYIYIVKRSTHKEI